MENDPQLTIELLWEDNELEHLAVSAHNGMYCGSTSAYFAQGDVQLLANAIRGFPKSTSQQEIFVGGNEDDNHAKLVFRCFDGLGHAVVDVILGKYLIQHAGLAIMNRVELALRFEPVALDEFCRELDEVARRKKTRAVLRGLPAPAGLGRG